MALHELAQCNETRETGQHARSDDDVLLRFIILRFLG